MNKKIKGLVCLFLILSFLAGIYVCLTNGFYPDFVKSRIKNNNGEDVDSDTETETDTKTEEKEGFEPNKTSPDCPDVLIKKGNSYILSNSKKTNIEGQNPIVFPNLDEYIQFVYSQQQKGLYCPALFLQQEVNTQGKDVYSMRPSPFYVEGGLPPLPTEIPTDHVIRKAIDSSRANPPYNANNYHGFDPYNQNVGIYTDIDQIHDSTMNLDKGPNPISENPMDTNWGGVEVTEQAVESGKYDDNMVTKVIYPAVMPYAPF
jgi:hypothetical protein